MNDVKTIKFFSADLALAGWKIFVRFAVLGSTVVCGINLAVWKITADIGFEPNFRGAIICAVFLATLALYRGFLSGGIRSAGGPAVDPPGNWQVLWRWAVIIIPLSVIIGGAAFFVRNIIIFFMSLCAELCAIILSLGAAYRMCSLKK
jgi:hypothetical protein